MINRRFSKKEKVYLLILAVLLLLCGYYYLVHLPSAQRMAAAEETLADLELTLAMETARTQRLQEMEQDLAAVISSGNLGHAEIPIYDNAQQLMLALNRALDATVFSIDFLQIRTVDALVERPIRIAFSCEDYAQARQIVTALYEIPYRNQISALSLQPIAPAGEESLAEHPVSAALTITFYETAGGGLS